MNPPTEERVRMRREEKKRDVRQRKLTLALQRARVGEERTRRRLETERRAAAQKRRSAARRAHREVDASRQLQAFYRGSVGRGVARKWGVKAAELDALRHLAVAAAVAVQRVFRGHLGRRAASVARMEMADFISTIRAEEAAADERAYWRTHPVARLRRDLRRFLPPVGRAGTRR